MRALVFTLALGAAGAALLPMHEAKAWWDHWGRWHPDYRRPVLVVPPPPIYAPNVRRPYALWVRPHYDRFGRFIPGHWG